MEHYLETKFNTSMNSMRSEGEQDLVFMPPTSKKLRGHIGLGLSVQSSPVQSSLSVMRE